MIRTRSLTVGVMLALVALAIPSGESAAIIQLTPTVSPASFTPGGVGTILLTMKNAGNVTAFQLETRVVSSDPPIKVNQTGVVALGGIGALETTTVMPFTFTVDRDASPGIYRVDATLNFNYLEGAATRYSSFNYGASIVVRATDNLLVQGVVPDRIEPGSDVAASIRIANAGNSEYFNVAGSWTSPSNTILPLGGSNQFQIPSIPANSAVDVPVRLAASNGAAPGLYALTFQITYNDVGGNVHNSTSTVGLWLGSGSGSELSVNIQNITDDKITVALTNVGLKGITGVQVRLVPTQGFRLDDTDTVVLGNILPGEFKTATYEISRTASNAAARADVEYTDSLGQRRAASEPLAFEQSAPAQAPSGAVIGVATAAIILAAQALIVAGWMARRRLTHRKAEKASEEEADFAQLAQAAQQDTDDLRR